MQLLPLRAWIPEFRNFRSMAFPSSSWSFQCPCGCTSVAKRYIHTYLIYHACTLCTYTAIYIFSLPLAMTDGRTLTAMVQSPRDIRGCQHTRSETFDFSATKLYVLTRAGWFVQHTFACTCDF